MAVPELPEVETVKETLNKLVTDKTIGHVDVRWPNIIQRPDDIKAFQMLLEGQTIDTIARRGKFLLFYLDDYVLVSHLRMEGKYRLEEQDTPIDKHTHVIFRFSDGTELRYRDVRKFGTMHLFNKGEEFNSSPLRQLGPEPLSDVFTSEYLYSKCQKTERTIKQVLLDQTIVVGLGNIYVDEALFCARLHPLTKAKHLSAADSERLYASIQETLREAVGLGGSTIRTYLNSQGEMGMFQQRLNVYGRQGDSCPNCGTPIEKIKAGGRGTHFCPVCQNRGDGK